MLIIRALRFIASFLVAAAILTAGGSEQVFAEVSTAEKQTITVSIPPQAYFVKRLAGEAVQVRVMLPAGVNHETYEPSMGRLQDLSRSKLYLTLGHPAFHFENAWLKEVLKPLRELKVVNGAEGISLDAGDPHYWLSPKLMPQVLKNYAAALSSLLPEKKTAIAEAEAKLLQELQALDQELENTFADYHSAPFLVFHPSWSYFAKDYSLNQVAIEAGGKEPGFVQLGKIIASAKALKLNTIFLEPGIPTQSIEALSTELSAAKVLLNPLAEDWFANIRFTAEALKKSFPTSAPQ